MDLQSQLNIYQQSVQKSLEYWLPEDNQSPTRLHAAMRYAVLGPGKRIRPVLVYAAGQTMGVALENLNGPACAVEMIHAYSLIHDDLPAMDDDDLRRGRPTCHRAFDEATAILAGDAIQALAFHVLAVDETIPVDAEQRLRMIDLLAIASGSIGMAGGQGIDLAAVGKSLSIDELQDMHTRKTGALIKASVQLGALCCQGVADQQLQHLSQYAHAIGLAFQIQDDILDIESDTETLGKPQGSDIARNKPTYPNLLGLDGAKKAAQRMHQQALDNLSGFDQRANTLRMIADYIVQRDK